MIYIQSRSRLSLIGPEILNTNILSEPEPNHSTTVSDPKPSRIWLAPESQGELNDSLPRSNNDGHYQVISKTFNDSQSNFSTPSWKTKSERIVFNGVMVFFFFFFLRIKRPQTTSGKKVFRLNRPDTRKRNVKFECEVEKWFPNITWEVTKQVIQYLKKKRNNQKKKKKAKPPRKLDFTSHL